MKKLNLLLFVLSIVGAVSGAVISKPDITRDKTLYAIGYAHLDTQWRWDYTEVIDEFLKATVDDNFRYFEKYPDYVFNFTGATRYAMIKEYYPERYKKLKQYIAQGRWFIAGSSLDECDVNLNYAESIIRHILYGNIYFKKEFGKVSEDFMLPDCFGFQAHLPSVWAHCGLKGFSTQKLDARWGHPGGPPFNIGVWEGLDGKSVIAALNPGGYTRSIKGPAGEDQEWLGRINENGSKYGVFADYHYYGVGDKGGAPREDDVKNYTSAINDANSLYRVYLTSSDMLFKDITPEMQKRLPKYKGDLLLTEHSAGSLTSEAYMKRWNRKNELLADSAERAAVTAMWLGGADYPQEKLNRSWFRILSSQMHDILPGTSLPRCYNFSWNDEVIGLNGFAAVLEDSVGTVSRAMDTRVKGVPILVYNPLAIVREDIVEANVGIKNAAESIRVYAPDGQEVPSQIIGKDGSSVKIAFTARTPSLGFAVYDVRKDNTACKLNTGLSITKNASSKEYKLENKYYTVTVNSSGDIAGIFNKENKKEILKSPARLAFLHEKPSRYPAWNMDWADRQNPPIGYVDGPASFKIIENGSVRAALEVIRKSRDSIFTQTIRLSAGDAGRRIEVKNFIDWQSTGVSLKAEFPLTAASPFATYNLTMGTFERGNNDPNKYEVPSHEWFDLTDHSGEYGVTILEDCKFGSDKPDDNTLRLTLLYTPGIAKKFPDQGTQDWGRHEILYGIYSHKGSWREGLSEWQGRRLNQPLVAFTVPVHSGGLGKEFSMLKINTPQVDVRALKKSEDGDYVIIRLQELLGKAADNVQVSANANIVEAFEIDGQERRIGDAKIADGKLTVNMTTFSPRSFAIKPAQPPVMLTKPQCKPIKLQYTDDVLSSDDNRLDGNMSKGLTMPAEMLGNTIVSEGIAFEMGGSSPGEKNAIACKGQKIPLPAGRLNRLYILASAVDDTKAVFTIAEQKTILGIQSWTGYIGQYDSRIWKYGDYSDKDIVVGFDPGYIKRDNLAWFCTHRHTPDKNDTYRFSYIFKYSIDIPNGADAVVLPDSPNVKIFAVTAAYNENDSAKPAQLLYDSFKGWLKIRLRGTNPPKPPHQQEKHQG